MVDRLRVSTVSADEGRVKPHRQQCQMSLCHRQRPGKRSLTSFGRTVPRLKAASRREIIHMREKRVSAAGTGGTRRHDDPPAWLNKSLPLEKRRSLLDRAIKEMAASQPAGAGRQKQ